MNDFDERMVTVSVAEWDRMRSQLSEWRSGARRVFWRVRALGDTCDLTNRARAYRLRGWCEREVNRYTPPESMPRVFRVTIRPKVKP